ncbi:helix-turn-helix transcriptional regulator [Roseovarius confluentis]|uniref:helix-turn-helix transcriptional regulator n=1 Tax=Roseovarius confluentis TaxID=1852027 RepID=UPI003BAD7C73
MAAVFASVIKDAHFFVRKSRPELQMETHLRLMSKSETAKFLGVSNRTLDRWHALRKGPARISAGRRVLYRMSAVSSWLSANEVEPVGNFTNGYDIT